MNPPVARPMLAFAAACVALAAPARAYAQWSTRDPRDGLEVAAFVGYGALTNDGAFRPSGTTGHGSLRGSVGFQFEAAYRIVPAFSAGLHGTFQLFALDVPSGTDGSASGGAMGPYVRFHPLALLAGHERDGDDAAGRLDVYVGIGFDFLATVGAGTRTSTLVGTLTTSASSAGVAMPIVVGAQYRLHPNVSVGIMAEWSYWTAASTCLSGLTGSASVCDTGPHDAESYLFVGAGVRGHFALLN